MFLNKQIIQEKRAEQAAKPQPKDNFPEVITREWVAEQEAERVAKQEVERAEGQQSINRELSAAPVVRLVSVKPQIDKAICSKCGEDVACIDGMCDRCHS